MSAWHREHPELAGTSADPWMANPAYARAYEQTQLEQRVRARFPNIDQLIADAEHNSSHVCVDPDCRYVQSNDHGYCECCGGPLTEREP